MSAQGAVAAWWVQHMTQGRRSLMDEGAARAARKRATRMAVPQAGRNHRRLGSAVLKGRAQGQAQTPSIARSESRTGGLPLGFSI